LTRRRPTVKEARAYARMGQTDLHAKIGTGDIISCKRGRKTLVVSTASMP